MIVLSLFEWWYGAGWKSAITHSQKRVIDACRLFEIPTLLLTIFSPWRRIITAPGAGLGAHVRAAADNAISRLVGLIVRSLVLISAGLIIALASIVSLVELLLWPFIPVSVVGFVVLGVIG